jgi:hypothetical protein
MPWNPPDFMSVSIVASAHTEETPKNKNNPAAIKAIFLIKHLP